MAWVRKLEIVVSWKELQEELHERGVGYDGIFTDDLTFSDDTIKLVLTPISRRYVDIYSDESKNKV